ncbi:uncharacterized protein LOC101856556 [Aplysia californica]|uniref:Uncharacterized protein LOC101856556 n=1 Tax=Aplysia californica TaxID=6500 RepID=A0ABM0JDQ2_APLCA|nr:uncharacterized protein LOC101856556 [Aplysia californica]
MIRLNFLHSIHRSFSQKCLAGHQRCSSVLLRNCYQAQATPQRCLITLTRRQTFKPQYARDKVEKTYDLVYENALKHILGPCRLLSTVAGLASAGGSVYALLTYSGMMEGWDVFALVSVFGISVVSVGVFNWIARYYLTRIYFNADKELFVGVYHTLLGRVKQIKYSTADLRLIQTPEVSAKLHLKSNVIIKDRTFHLKGSDFLLPKYYNMHLQL